MSEQKMILGAGGGGGDMPDRTDDNLFSEDVVEFALAVSEGTIRGLTKGANTFYVGDTQLVSDTGGLNFSKFAIGVYPGYSEESSKPLALKLGGITSNSVVNVGLDQYVPVTRQTSATLRNQIDELEVRILFQRLMHVDDDGGTDYETAIFLIEYKTASALAWTSYNGGPTSIRGKTSTGYPKDFRIPVPRVNEDWMVRVTKHSVDNSPSNVIELAWESLQATTRGEQKFPWVGVVHGLGVANGQFSSIPEFSGVYDGIIVRVPTNYNPDLRTYDETTPWDGSFKFAWTNNNAWILYHLLVDTRAGLAAHYSYVDVNRFDFYAAAKWCDQEVPAGTGTQPRFTFNSVINEPRNALEMLAYVAGSFNAVIYDDLSGKIHLRVDRDDVASHIFTPENVTVEGFNYTYTDITSRYNDISVTFVNPDLDWNEDRRRIAGVTTDEEAISRYGRIPYDFIAVGCTNDYEAIRRAQHRLLTAQTETTMVSFKTTRLGVLTELFDVILVADPSMGWSLTGRILRYDSEYIYLRDSLFIESNDTYLLKVQTIYGIEEVAVLVDELGYVNRLRLAQPMPENVPEQTVFSLEQVGGLGLAKPFRITSIEPVEGSPYQFQLSAIEINRAKYSLGDIVGELPTFQYSFKQPTLPTQPNSVIPKSGDNYVLTSPTGDIFDRIYLSWRAGSLASGITGYEVRWRRTIEDSEWEIQTVTGESAFTGPVLTGVEYTLQVRSLMLATKSAWVSVTHVVNARAVTPEPLINLTAEGGLFKNKLSWEYGQSPDYKLVEIWGSTVNNTTTFGKMSDIVYPQHDWEHIGLGAGQRIYYRLRAMSRTNVYSEWTSVVDAQTDNDPGVLLDILAGQISETELAEDLLSDIEDAQGKVQVFRQNTPPVAKNTGDLWYDDSSNLLMWSEQFQQTAVWIAVAGAVVTADSTAAPDGTVTADAVTFGPTENARVDQVTTNLPAIAGDTYTYSVWLKGPVGQTCRIALNSTLGTGGQTETIVTLTAAWVRYSVTHTFPSGVTGFVRPHGVIKRSGDTATVAYCWGAQLEKKAQMGRYVKREATFDSTALNWVFYWNGASWVQTDNTTIEKTRAAIVTEESARIAGDSANATLVTNLQATLANAPGNRLKNSSFEADSNSDGTADGWAVYNEAAMTVVASLVAGRVQGYAQRFNFTSAATTSQQGLRALDSVNNPAWVAGKTYVISFYSKASSGSGQLSRTMSLQWNVAPATTTALLNPPLTTDWQRYAFRIVWGGSVEPAGRLYISTATTAPARNGDVIFDDIQVEEGTTYTAYISTDSAAALAAVQVEAAARVAADNGINTTLSASYSIKTQVTTAGGYRYLAGISLGVDGSGGTVSSQVLVAADTFAVVHPNGSVIGFPFVIEGGAVYMDTAFIKDATITSGKIVNATIGSAKFANWLESDTLIGGVPVLSMNFRTGQIVANNIKARGDVEATSLKADTANIVKTLHINGDVFVTPRASAFKLAPDALQRKGMHALCSVSIQDMPPGGTVLCLIRFQSTANSASYVVLTRNGAEIFRLATSSDEVIYVPPYDESGRPPMTTMGLRGVQDTPPAGTSTYVLYHHSLGGHTGNITAELILLTVKKGS